MIVFQEQLEPEVKLNWAIYKAPARIGWLHSDNKELDSIDQRKPSEGLRTVIPSAVFTIANYFWDSVEW